MGFNSSIDGFVKMNFGFEFLKVDVTSKCSSSFMKLFTRAAWNSHSRRTRQQNHFSWMIQETFITLSLKQILLLVWQNYFIQKNVDLIALLLSKCPVPQLISQNWYVMIVNIETSFSITCPVVFYISCYTWEVHWKTFWTLTVSFFFVRQQFLLRLWSIYLVTK